MYEGASACAGCFAVGRTHSAGLVRSRPGFREQVQSAFHVLGFVVTLASGPPGLRSMFQDAHDILIQQKAFRVQFQRGLGETAQILRACRVAFFE